MKGLHFNEDKTKISFMTTTNKISRFDVQLKDIKIVNLK